MKKGVPHCPNCKLPIESELIEIGICRCIWCASMVKTLTARQQVEMINNLDANMLKEWEIEVKSR